MAGRIPDDKIDQIRQLADIVEIVGKRVRLTARGKDFWGCCPFHQEKTPSFKVDRQRNSWHCFGCGEGGTIFNFVMRDLNISFPEAVRELAGIYGVEIPEDKLDPAEEAERQKRDNLLHALEFAGKFFEQTLNAPAADYARDYLDRQRGLGREAIRDFGLGWAPPEWEGLSGFLARHNIPQELAMEAGLLVRRSPDKRPYDRFRSRVMFPIHDSTGRIISFGGRALGDDEPKYLNGPETLVFHKSRTLYNLSRARNNIRRTGRAILVEGYFDVITLATHGFGETVAPLGTAVTKEQIRLLKSLASEVVLIFDGDRAGQRAAEKALSLFLAEDVLPQALCLPSGEDPDSFLRHKGSEAFTQALAQCRPLLEIVLDDYMISSQAHTPEGKSKVVALSAPLLNQVKDQVVRAGYLQSLSQKLGIPLEVIAARAGLPLTTIRAKKQAGHSAPPKTLHIDNSLTVLELALASPKAAQALYDNDALAEPQDHELAAIVRTIIGLLQKKQEATAQSVMLALEDQSLCKRVTALQARRAVVDENLIMAEVSAHIASLGQRSRKQQLAALRSSIDEAEQRGDHAEAVRLQQKRRRLISSSPAGKE